MAVASIFSGFHSPGGLKTSSYPAPPQEVKSLQRGVRLFCFCQGAPPPPSSSSARVSEVCFGNEGGREEQSKQDGKIGKRCDV